MAHNLTKSLKIIAILYVGALLLSWCVQYFFPTSDKPNLYQKEKNIEVSGKQISHSYYSLDRKSKEQTLVLLPDLFGGAEFLIPLARELQDSVNVIIPEFPTSTTSDRSIPYSVESRSDYVNVLLDSLNVQNVHLVGHGYGGLIGINLASEETTNRFQSLTLISSYGPQELQFLGNHLTNRSLYSMLYPAVTVFKYLIPHMGWYYEQPVNFDFAKTLTALDQRPVREQLSNIEMPVHIIQPVDDRYVSLAIAEEIYRLVPHSSLFVIDGDHLTTKENPSLLDSSITEFISRVDQNFAKTRQNAEKSRVEDSRAPFDTENFETIGGWTLVIIMFLIIMIAIFSEDLACIAGGLLVASGIIDFWFAVLAACLGVLIPDVILYALGRYIGNPILKWIPFRWFIKQEDIVKAEQMYRMRGVEIIFATRFLPGTRLPVYLVSGMISVKFSFFLFYFILAMIIWAPLLVWVSALVGQPMISYLTSYQDYALWLIPIILGMVYIVVKGVTLVSTPTGRRKVMVKFSRFRERYFGEK
ncbi:MAG: alpha/beta fold hydrolase [Balneolaceae bacterium]|nr:alpha/beta fold hydrolase [Balneolaceae bacterium]